MLAVTRLQGDDLLRDAEPALLALAGRPGFLRGRVGRALDDPLAWVLVTEWCDVGSYRRALSSYDVKVAATSLFVRARDEVGTYEVVLTAGEPSRPSEPDEPEEKP